LAEAERQFVDDLAKRPTQLPVPVVVSRRVEGIGNWVVLGNWFAVEAAAARGVRVLTVVMLRELAPQEATETHAVLNRPRSLSEYDKCRLAEDVEPIFRTRAVANMRRGGGDKRSASRTSGQEAVAGPEHGQTRDLIGRLLGESGKTAELRLKLMQTARKEDASHPETTAIGLALQQSDATVHAVARTAGLLPARPPAKRAPTSVKAAIPRKAQVIVLLDRANSALRPLRDRVLEDALTDAERLDLIEAAPKINITISILRDLLERNVVVVVPPKTKAKGDSAVRLYRLRKGVEQSIALGWSVEQIARAASVNGELVDEEQVRSFVERKAPLEPKGTAALRAFLQRHESAYPPIPVVEPSTD
jgi:hypothetical protein